MISLKNVNMSKNIRSVVTLIFLTFFCIFMLMLLWINRHDKEMMGRMEVGMATLMGFIFGFYYNASHLSQPNSTHTDKTETIRTSIQDANSDKPNETATT